MRLKAKIKKWAQANSSGFTTDGVMRNVGAQSPGTNYPVQQQAPESSTKPVGGLMNQGNSATQMTAPEGESGVAKTALYRVLKKRAQSRADVVEFYLRRAMEKGAEVSGSSIYRRSKPTAASAMRNALKSIKPKDK